MTITRRFLHLAALAFPALVPSAFLSAAEYEAAPQRPASDAIASDLRQSPNHRISDEVRVKGNFYEFSLQSDYGDYPVTSLALLSVRVHETRVLAQAVDSFNRTDRQLADEVRGQLRVGADSWSDIVTSPVRTAASLTSQLATNIGQTVNELNDLSSEAALRRSRRGFGAASDPQRRSVANQLELDVYSSNPAVQEFLTVLARTRAGGNVGGSMPKVSVRNPRLLQVAGGALDFKLRSRLKNFGPEALDIAVDGELASMGIDSDHRTLFLDHLEYTPRHKVSIAAHLGFLEGVANRGTIIEAALAARSEADALSYERLARMLALYHEKVAKIRALQPGGLPVGVTRDKDLVIFLPVDIVYWNKETAGIFELLSERVRGGNDFRRREAIVLGSLSDLARRELRRLGFEYRERFLERN